MTAASTARRWRAKGIPAKYQNPEYDIPKRLEPLPSVSMLAHARLPIRRTSYIRQRYTPLPTGTFSRVKNTWVVSPARAVKLVYRNVPPADAGKVYSGRFEIEFAYGGNDRWLSPKGNSAGIEIFPVYAIVTSYRHIRVRVVICTISHTLFYWATVLAPKERLLLDHTTHKLSRRITLAELRAGPEIDGSIATMSSLEIAGELHADIKRASAMSYFPINLPWPWHWHYSEWGWRFSVPPLSWEARQDTSRTGERVDFRESFGPSKISAKRNELGVLLVAKPLAVRSKLYHARPYEPRVSGVVGKFTYDPHDFVRGDSDSGIRGRAALKVSRAEQRSPSTMTAEEVDAAVDTAAAQREILTGDHDQERRRAIREAQKEDQAIEDSLTSWDAKNKRLYDPTTEKERPAPRELKRATVHGRRHEAYVPVGVGFDGVERETLDTLARLRAEEDRIVGVTPTRRENTPLSDTDECFNCAMKWMCASCPRRHRTPLPINDPDAFRPCLKCSTVPEKWICAPCPRRCAREDATAFCAEALIPAQ